MAVTAEQQRIEAELVRQHLALVHYAVNEMLARVPRHVSRSDLLSAGMEGLAHAARNFNPDRGVTFPRYASARIRGALLDELRRRDWASRSVRSRARKVDAATTELKDRLGRMPTPAEVGEATAMGASEVLATRSAVERANLLHIDTDSPDGPAALLPAGDDVVPDSVLLERERQAYLHDSIGALPERLRRVVYGYFFEERPMQELADELGVTESRISQMRAEAITLLRDGMNSQLDPEAVAPRPPGRAAARRSAYYAAIAAASDTRSRLSVRPRQLASTASA